MNRILVAALATLAALGCGGRAEEPPAFEKVEVERILPLATKAKTTVADRAEVARLATFFPGMGRGKKSDIAAGWKAGYRLRFIPAKGNAVQITVHSDGGVWSEGHGDWQAKPGLKEHLDRLFDKKKDELTDAGWSEALRGLRGRLVRHPMRRSNGTEIIGITLELRNGSTEPLAVLANAEAARLRVFGPDGVPVKEAGLPRSGPVPGPQVAVIPRDAYLGFSLYDYGWGVPRDAGALLPVRSGGPWVLEPGTYTLRGTFEVQPPEGETYRKNGWGGRLDLPALEIEVR